MTQNKVGISFADNLSAIIALLILLAGLIAPAARADSCTFSPGTVTLPLVRLWLLAPLRSMLKEAARCLVLGH